MAILLQHVVKNVLINEVTILKTFQSTKSAMHMQVRFILNTLVLIKSIDYHFFNVHILIRYLNSSIVISFRLYKIWAEKR